MKITWHGHACFSITHDGYTVVIDPYNADYTAGYPKLHLKADKLLISHEHYGHNCREAVTLSGRPESDCPFEISTLEVSHDSVCGIMRGMGAAVVPMLVSILGACAFRIFWIYAILPLHSTLGMLYISYPVSWILTGSVHLICCFALLRRYPIRPCEEEET